jgi:EmrB/QacA subfamily drug resistance transporter
MQKASRVLKEKKRMEKKPEQHYNRGILLAVIMITSFFNPFMSSAVSIALPRIGNEFHMSAVALSWIAMAFLLSSAVLLVPFGKLADIWGRKRMLLAGNIVFTVFTLVCALSVSGRMLIFARVMQGFGSAMILSTGMALIISAFPAERRGRIIGVNTSATYVGLSAAPLVGGFITQHWGWHSLFYINAAAGVLIILGIVYGVKTEWAEAKNDRFDLAGSIVYLLAMSSMMYGFSQLPGKTGTLLTIAGAAGLIGFVVMQLKIATPVLDIRLFRDNKIFAFSNLAALINYAATFAITFVLSVYLQKVKGFSPVEAGMILVTQPVLMAIVASISGRMADRIDSRILASSGMGIIAAGLVLLVFLSPATEKPYMVGTLALLGLGFGLFSSPNTHSVMSSVEKKFLGTASATLGTMRLTGMMFSMAIAAMAIHLFIGEAAIDESTVPGFMRSVRTIFIVFSVLCAAGVFASMARGRRSAQ